MMQNAQLDTDPFPGGERGICTYPPDVAYASGDRHLGPNRYLCRGHLDKTRIVSIKTQKSMYESAAVKPSSKRGRYGTYIGV